MHDARHTYASLMLRRGVPPAYVGPFIPGGDRHHVEGLEVAQTFEESSRAAAEAERA